VAGTAGDLPAAEKSAKDDSTSHQEDSSDESEDFAEEFEEENEKEPYNFGEQDVVVNNTEKEEEEAAYWNFIQVTEQHRRDLHKARQKADRPGM
jgi:hypothetical protein